MLGGRNLGGSPAERGMLRGPREDEGECRANADGKTFD